MVLLVYGGLIVAKSQSKLVICPFLDIRNNMADGTKCAALQHIVSSMPDYIFWRRNLITDTYDYISPSFQQILGLSADELSTMTTNEILHHVVHPDDQLRLQDAITHLIRCETKNLTVEHRLKCRDGNYRWFSETLSVYLDEKGIASAIIGCAQDISATIQLRAALAVSEHRLKNLFHNAKVALFRSTVKGDRLLECNNLFAWALGFSSPAQCTDGFTFAQNSVNSAEYEKLISDMRDPRIVNNHEIQLRRKDGGLCWMSVSAFWLEREEYFDGSAMDITAAKELSEIEVSILKLLLAGLSNKEIAARLSRSRRTVEEHRASIMKKLNAQNIVDLATHYQSVII
jgi:PAS domain S-box-containing protein